MADMVIPPIQVNDTGVLIPRSYLQDASEFEFEVIDGYVLVRPKANGGLTLRPSTSSRFSFVGIAETRNPNASVEVEEILERELGVRNE